jgi:hypothetical protein
MIYFSTGHLAILIVVFLTLGFALLNAILRMIYLTRKHGFSIHLKNIIVGLSIVNAILIMIILLIWRLNFSIQFIIRWTWLWGVFIMNALICHRVWRVYQLIERKTLTALGVCIALHSLIELVVFAVLVWIDVHHNIVEQNMTAVVVAEYFFPAVQLLYTILFVGFIIWLVHQAWQMMGYYSLASEKYIKASIY